MTLKVCYLTRPSTQAWKGQELEGYVNQLSKKGYEIHIFGKTSLFKNDERVFFHDIKINNTNSSESPHSIPKSTNSSYLTYFRDKAVRTIDFIKVNNKIQKIKPDIIHSFECSNWGFKSTFLRSDAKRIVNCHGFDIYKFPFQSQLNYDMTKRALDFNDLIIIRSYEGKSFLIDKFQIPESKIIVFDGGINLEKMPLSEFNASTRFSTLKKYDLVESDLVIIINRGLRKVFWPILNFFLILDKLVAQYPSIKVILLKGNSDELYPKINNILEKKNIADKVRYIDDFVDYKEMLNIYSISDICLSLPSRDNLSYVVSESLWFGCLTVLSDLEQYREVFEDEKHLFFVKKGNKNELLKILQRIISNLDSYKESIVPVSRDLVKKNFSNNYNFQKMDKVYKELVL